MLLCPTKTTLLALVVLAGCAASPKVDQLQDSCAPIFAIGKAILSEENADNARKRAALAHHVIDNATCFDPDTVAKSRLVLTSPTPTATFGQDADECPAWAGRYWPGCNVR